MISENLVHWGENRDHHGGTSPHLLPTSPEVCFKSAWTIYPLQEPVVTLRNWSTLNASNISPFPNQRNTILRISKEIPVQREVYSRSQTKLDLIPAFPSLPINLLGHLGPTLLSKCPETNMDYFSQKKQIDPNVHLLTPNGYPTLIIIFLLKRKTRFVFSESNTNSLLVFTEIEGWSWSITHKASSNTKP